MLYKIASAMPHSYYFLSISCTTGGPLLLTLLSDYLYSLAGPKDSRTTDYHFISKTWVDLIVCWTMAMVHSVPA